MTVTYQTREAVDIKTPKLTRLQQEARIGLLFLLPWIIGFILLKALPILAAFVFALTDFQMLTPEETSFVGLSNYIRFLGEWSCPANSSLCTWRTGGVYYLSALGEESCF